MKKYLILDTGEVIYEFEAKDDVEAHIKAKEFLADIGFPKNAKFELAVVLTSIIL